VRDRGVFIAEPDTGWSRRLAGYAVPVSELAFSADGAFVAYVVGDKLAPAADRVVAWARTTAPGEAGRAYGTGYAWGPEKATLFVVDPRENALVRWSAEVGTSKRLCEAQDDPIPDYPPRVAVAAEAKRIAFTLHRAAKDWTELWVLSRDGAGEPSASLLTQVPGAEIVLEPFWSPGGGTIGLHIVHPGQEQSAIILVPRLQGDGEIYHESERVDGAAAPAWSPSSRFVAFFPADGDGQERLSLLDCASPEHALVPILDPGEAAGSRPRFVDAHNLALEGGAAALVLSFNDPL